MELNIYQSINRIQQEFSITKEDGDKNRYFPLEKINSELKRIINQFSLPICITNSRISIDRQTGVIECDYTLTNTDKPDEKVVYTCSGVLGEKILSHKGGAIMTWEQIAGCGITYLRRYALCGIFLISAGEMDVDSKEYSNKVNEQTQPAVQPQPIYQQPMAQQPVYQQQQQPVYQQPVQQVQQQPVQQVRVTTANRQAQPAVQPQKQNVQQDMSWLNV